MTSTEIKQEDSGEIKQEDSGEIKQEDSDEEEEEYENTLQYEEEEEDENPLQFRMYENEYPLAGDLVVVEVRKIESELGAYCNLLEFDNLEGMLLMTELQRKRIRSVKKVIKEGRQEIVEVLRVNRKKNFIDLSKKRVDQQMIPKVEDRWNKSKAAHSIMRQTCVLSKKKYSMKQLYKIFGWQMAKDFGHLYDAFKYAMANWTEALERYPDIPKDILCHLRKNIDKRLKPQIVTVRAKLEITCFTREGVDAIKKALKCGLHLSSDEFVIKIKLVAPPLFTISVATLEPDKGIFIVQNVLNAIHDSILASNGSFTLKQRPEVIADII